MHFPTSINHRAPAWSLKQLTPYLQIHYVAQAEGAVVDDSREREPLEFVVDEGKVIQGLSRAVAGLSVGQKNSLTVQPEEAFGKTVYCITSNNLRQ